MSESESNIQHIIRQQEDGVWWSRRSDDGTSWNLFLGPVREAEVIKKAMAAFLRREDSDA